MRKFLLSESGSDRATAYHFNNKAITRDGKTTVTYADCQEEAGKAPLTLVRTRTYDWATHTWSPARCYGVAVDNHAASTLCCNDRGELRLAFGPHGPGAWRDAHYPDNWPTGSFKWFEAQGSQSLEECEATPHHSFGYNATYASLICTPNGQECMVYRGGEQPLALMLQRRTRWGHWNNAIPLMVQDIAPGYTFYGAQIACDSRNTLYVGGSFYNMKPDGTSLGACVLMSKDGGHTWSALNGGPQTVPITYLPELAVPHPPTQYDPRLWSLVVDATDQLWALSGSSTAEDGAVLLSKWNGDHWETEDLAPHLSASISNCNMVQGVLSVDTGGTIHVVVSALDDACKTQPGFSPWGHISQEIYHLKRAPGSQNFDVIHLSDGAPEVANWLPSISQPGPHHPVDAPVILWTRGLSNQEPGCRTRTQTQVWCALCQ